MTDSGTMEFEQLVAEIRRLLPEPVEEQPLEPSGSQFIGGEPGEVVVELQDGTLTVSVFAVHWETPYTPRVRPEPIESVHWQELPASRLLEELRKSIVKARQKRRRRFRVCARCGNKTPPEWMHDRDTCQSCAERDLGVVY